MKVSGKRHLVMRTVAPLAALLLLAGCGELTPGTAATVDGHRITMHQVRDLAAAQCDAVARTGGGQAGAAVPMTQVQQRSLGLLLQIQLTKQYAAARGLHADPRIVDYFWSQYRQPIAQLPGRTGAVLGRTFHDFAEARALLVAAGSRSTGEAPRQDNLDKLTEAGIAARQKWVNGIQVHTDARFGPDQHGAPGAGDGSVSMARSDFARKATASQSDPAWVAGLPAGQKCG